jgi:hypothetical protein
MAGTPARSTTVTPTRLSPEGSDAALDLPRGCKLEVEWDGKEPRLLLRKGNKHQLQWPLEELTRIEVCHDASVGEPCLRFTLGSNVEHLQKPPSDPECLAAFNGGALRRGPKVFFLTSKDAKDVYAALCERKAAGLPCLADTQCCETSRGPPPLAGEDNVAALGLLSLAADPPASQRQQSVATSVASDASSSVSSVRETLIFVCSPKKGPLPSAKDEAIDERARDFQPAASSSPLEWRRCSKRRVDALNGAAAAAAVAPRACTPCVCSSGGRGCGLPPNLLRSSLALRLRCGQQQPPTSRHSNTDGSCASSSASVPQVANETPAFIRRGGSPTDLKQELLHGRGAYKCVLGTLIDYLPLSSLYLLTYSLTHSLAHSLTYAHTHSLTNAHTHTRSLTRSLAHSLLTHIPPQILSLLRARRRLTAGAPAARRHRRRRRREGRRGMERVPPSHARLHERDHGRT